MKTITLEEELATLSPESRAQIDARLQELIVEEMTLKALRKARAWTQVRVAQELGVHQVAVSRMEQRSDLLLSTLRAYVESLGGSLSLVAEFPDRPPVVITGFGDLDYGDPPAGVEVPVLDDPVDAISDIRDVSDLVESGAPGENDPAGSSNVGEGPSTEPEPASPVAAPQT